jgi:hypothetical protein
MKKLSMLVSAAMLLSMVACNHEAKKEEAAAPVMDTTTAEKMAEEAPAPVMDSAAMMKAWEAYMTPGDMHKWIASTDGKWTGEVISWMKPDAPPSKASKVTAENKTIMGGRYQESVFHGEMMGMPFEGHGTLAYDNAKKKFVNTWIDNMGTGVMVMEGTMGDDKTLTMTGKMMDPSKGKEVEMRQVLKMPDEKTQIMEMYCKQDGKEFKNMEMKLTKK